MGIINWIPLILLFTLFGAVGGYFFKKASGDGLAINKVFVSNFIAGAFFYGTGALLNIYVLKFLPYTVVFPLTSITYIWTMLLSSIFLKEIITVRKIIGVGCIIIGSFLLMH
ncbi:EamA family transporter [Alteribacillus sp. HJP-4]|uniref:EamA family transporter n=1 Tax=Alteribacillus sp. HJP-4 TaxID=2775394 RepID=UPI0035CD063C